MADKVSSIEEVKNRMKSVFQPDKAAGVDAVYQFDLTGDDGGKYWIKVANGGYEAGEGQHDSPNITVTSTTADYISIINGEMQAMSAFMSGKLKVKGDMGLALKLQSIFPTGG